MSDPKDLEKLYPKCYFIFQSETIKKIQSVSFDNWTVYLVYTKNVEEWIKKLQNRPTKYFIQKKNESFDYSDNGLYKSLFNQIPISWIQFILKTEPEISRLSLDLQLISDNNKIWPDVNNIFKIFHLIKPTQINVMIIGQDPYPQPNIADGIAFSTSLTSIPPPLQNIFKQLEYEHIKVDNTNPNLTRWVTQGCFLINSAWTLTENKLGSHTNLWKRFVEQLIRYVLEINKDKKIPVVFFGNEAKTKFNSVAKSYPNATILAVAHPSPRSAPNGFFNSQIFTKINEHILNAIDWT